ncbi:RNA dependent RNA polymerase-domain-containing protein [Mycena haematopus]|nr:RNA dependent RNA polymerase-domain-containing protein [Mycena haematopus]
MIRLLLDLSTDKEQVVSDSEYDVHESRATRLVGDSTRFMTVSFTKKTRENSLKKWLQDITLPGKSITYGEHDYVFFGFTESNLKSGHVLFFREGPDFTVSELKDHFGSDLKTVFDTFGYGKYSARLGLSFSSTVATQEIKPEDRHLLPDLKADDGSLFSDGCGLIRDSFAQEISVPLGVPFDTAVFQIRLGGIKGTLTRCPDALFDHICGCRGKKLAYRQSMVKYNDGRPLTLEVQNVSRPPKSGRLNKQFIVLLLTLGVPLSVFEGLLQKQLDDIDLITSDRERALDCVDGEVDAGGDAFHQALYEMLLAGHDMNEPYLASQLRQFQNTTREKLRTKLNICLKSSGYFLGVVDHCGVLKEGEIYINLPTKGGPHVGPVATMRNPAYDPDGIRVLEAVNRPELKHLKNCIVFAASGARSEPDRMGGGDLDGDSYFVIFDQSLIPNRRMTKSPAAVVKKPLTHSKTIVIGGRPQTISGPTPNNKDMRTAAIETFVTMRCNFLLGSLSNEWMALVGTTPELADSPPCKALVPMLEAALDIVKSGGGINILKNDFDRFKNSNPGVRRTVDWTNPLDHLAGLVPQAHETGIMDFTPDPQLILREKTTEAKWDAMVQEAERVMPVYNKSLRNAIEADKEAKRQGLQEDERRADLAKAAFITKHFPPVENILEDNPKYLLKASAWYFTGYDHGKQSFAWLGARWLNQIKASNCGYIPIAVGARSTPLAGISKEPRTTPSRPKVKAATHLPPTPMSLARSSARPRMEPDPLLTATVNSNTEEDRHTDVDTDGFEVINKPTVYGSAVEDLVPAVSRLRIDTTPMARPIVRENSDDTLVNDEIPPVRTHVPASPVSPSNDINSRPQTSQQRRMVASPKPSDITTTRPRPRAQERMPDVPRVRSPQSGLPHTRVRAPAVSPTPAPTMRKRGGHTHEFLIQPSHPRRVRVCACGALWPASGET